MKYLSDDWVAAASDALRQAGSAPVAITIDQCLEDAGVHTRLRFELGDDATIRRLAADDAAATAAAATFHQSVATAVAVANGTTDTHQAFLLGHIRFEGSIERLIEGRESLVWLQGVLAPVMQATVFD